MPDEPSKTKNRVRPRWVESFEDPRSIRVERRELAIALVLTGVVLLALALLPGSHDPGGPNLLERLVQEGLRRE